MSHTTSYLAQHIVTSKLVFCENCKRVFETDIDSHINECPLCDVPNSMPEIPECVAKELASRDKIITRLKEDAERLADIADMFGDDAIAVLKHRALMKELEC
jgi:hypothetical protein